MGLSKLPAGPRFKGEQFTNPFLTYLFAVQGVIVVLYFAFTSLQMKLIDFFFGSPFHSSLFCFINTVATFIAFVLIFFLATDLACDL